MISLFKVHMTDDLTNVNNVLKSGYITEGPKVKQFEKQLEDFIGTNVLTVNSGTSALTLCFRLLLQPDIQCNWPGFDIKKDVVLTTPLTCTASNWSILANNMKLKWVDTNRTTGMISLKDIENKLNEHTKIILFVHWGGVPCDLQKLDVILNNHEHKYGFRPRVIEDCAHAFGAELNDKMIGNHGNLCIFSFQAIKHLTTIDGGCICFPKQFELLYQRAKKLRWFGIDRDNRGVIDGDFRKEEDILEFGYKFHMNDVNAAVGITNLPYVKKLISICQNNARMYLDLLKDVPQVQFMKTPVNCKPSYWLFSMRLLNTDKADFIHFMKSRDIMVSQVHKRNDLHTCVQEFKTSLPQLDLLVKELICIPCGWWITETDVKYIVDCIKQYFIRSSYKTQELNYGDILKTLGFTCSSKNTAIEFGILDAFSTNILAQYFHKVDAYDIFDDFKGNHAKSISQLKVSDNVEIQYGDFFDMKLLEKYKDNSIDLIHIDIANTGEVLAFALEHWGSKLTRDGVLILEGGSDQRDQVEWMLKYQKTPIRPQILSIDTSKWEYTTLGKIPSITIIRRRNA